MILAAVLAAAACSDGEPQVIEEYLPVEISFILSDPDGLIDEGSEVAVISGCLRDGETVSMSAAPVARFKTSAAVSGRVEITPVSDDDKVYARYGDTRITYTVISPYSGNASLEPQIPAEQKYGEPFPTLVYGSVTTDDVSVPVVVPVLSRPAGAVLSLKIPSDLVASKTAVLSGLSVLGVSVDFGDGLELSVDRTVDVLVEPFTVPQGGSQTFARCSRRREWKRGSREVFIRAPSCWQVQVPRESREARAGGRGKGAGGGKARALRRAGVFRARRSRGLRARRGQEAGVRPSGRRARPSRDLPVPLDRALRHDGRR